MTALPRRPIISDKVSDIANPHIQHIPVLPVVHKCEGLCHSITTAVHSSVTVVEQLCHHITLIKRGRVCSDITLGTVLAHVSWHTKAEWLTLNFIENPIALQCSEPLFLESLSIACLLL